MILHSMILFAAQEPMTQEPTTQKWKALGPC